MKKGKILLSVLAAAFITLSACEKDSLTSEEKGRKASAEFCECMKKNSLGDCEDKLNREYGYYSSDSEFIKAFNSASECDITISKK